MLSKLQIFKNIGVMLDWHKEIFIINMKNLLISINMPD